MADALEAKGYDYRYVFARGARHVDRRVVRQTLASALEWLWRDSPKPEASAPHANATRVQPASEPQPINRLDEMVFGITLGLVVGCMCGFGARREGWGAPKYSRVKRDSEE